MDIFHLTWTNHPTSLTDPTRKFVLSWSKLFQAYIDLQALMNQTTNLSSQLQEKLVSIKLYILDESELFQNEEFQAVRTQIREVELIEANKWQSMSRVKWLGIGDKPYKLFFKLLKAMQQRKNMEVLITDSGDTLVNKGEVL